jgi:hypothetical protein
MKVKIYFEGKEVCEIKCDSYLTTNKGIEKDFKSIDLFLKNQIIAHFDSKYSFVIINENTQNNHSLLKDVINGGSVTVPYKTSTYTNHNYR